MNFFSKSPKKNSSKKTPPTTTPTNDIPDEELPSRSRSPTKKSSSSPSKGKKDKDRDEHSKPAAPSSSRNSRTFPKTGSGSSRHHTFDLNDHPLNLPPELRRYSTMSAMSSM